MGASIFVYDANQHFTGVTITFYRCFGRFHRLQGWPGWIIRVRVSCPIVVLNVSFSGLITSDREEKADFSSIVYSIVIMWFLVCSHVEDFNARNKC